MRLRFIDNFISIDYSESLCQLKISSDNSIMRIYRLLIIRLCPSLIRITDEKVGRLHDKLMKIIFFGETNKIPSCYGYSHCYSPVL